jgi:phosphatidylserine decarboxylase
MSSASPGDRAFALLQALLPQHLIARCVHALARRKTTWLKNTLIRLFIRAFDVDLRESIIREPTDFVTFNAFFTRALAPGTRPAPAAPNVLACPVDGAVSTAGAIDGERLFQAKGHDYSLRALLAGDATLAERFRNGSFATLYLAPRDYHRVHMPITGRLREMIYVPGRLYSVNARTERTVPGLFARNERVVCVFDSLAGPLVVVFVGALIVGSIETAWHGEVRALRRRIERWSYDPAVAVERGAEIGRFNVGSTIIVLCARGRVRWDASIREGAIVRVGQPLGVADISRRS